jgi:hypothetical protein
MKEDARRYPGWFARPALGVAAAISAEGDAEGLSAEGTPGTQNPANTRSAHIVLHKQEENFLEFY